MQALLNQFYSYTAKNFSFAFNILQFYYQILRNPTTQLF